MLPGLEEPLPAAPLVSWRFPPLFAPAAAACAVMMLRFVPPPLAAWLCVMMGCEMPAKNVRLAAPTNATFVPPTFR